MACGWISLTLQRKRDQPHVATVASPHTSCEGEMALQSEILGKLQRGCIAVVTLREPDGELNKHKVSLNLLRICRQYSDRRCSFNLLLQYSILEVSL